MINKKLVATMSLVALLILPIMASAAPVVIPPQPVGGFSIEVIVGKILGIMWQLFVAAFFIFLFIAAFYFLTAQGEPEGIAKARQALIWAVASLVIAIVSFSIPAIIVALFTAS